MHGGSVRYAISGALQLHESMSGRTGERSTPRKSLPAVWQSTVTASIILQGIDPFLHLLPLFFFLASARYPHDRKGVGLVSRSFNFWFEKLRFGGIIPRHIFFSRPCHNQLSDTANYFIVKSHRKDFNSRFFLAFGNDLQELYKYCHEFKFCLPKSGKLAKKFAT